MCLWCKYIWNRQSAGHILNVKKRQRLAVGGAEYLVTWLPSASAVPLAEAIKCVSWHKAMLTITHLPNNAFPSSNRALSVTQKEIFSALLSSTLPLGFSDPDHCQSTSHVIHHSEMQRQPFFDNRQHGERFGRAASFLLWNSPVGWVSTCYAWLGH